MWLYVWMLSAFHLFMKLVTIYPCIAHRNTDIITLETVRICYLINKKQIPYISFFVLLSSCCLKTAHCFLLSFDVRSEFISWHFIRGKYINPTGTKFYCLELVSRLGGNICTSVKCCTKEYSLPSGSSSAHFLQSNKASK